jgi:hypothetical protein
MLRSQTAGSRGVRELISLVRVADTYNTSMEYTVEQAQRIFEKLIEYAHKRKKVIIVEGNARCQLLPINPARKKRKKRGSR